MFLRWLQILWEFILRIFIRRKGAPDEFIRVIMEVDHWLVKSPATGWLKIPRDGRWVFNGDLSHPTFNPSVVEEWDTTDGEHYMNHVFVRNGRIEYLRDCSHSFAGQTVDIPPLTPAEVAFNYQRKS